jgi:hypothetical protein
MTNEIKYEVAFSFLQQDEELVSQIDRLLQERLSTFVYSERQLDLVGKDGELILKNAFGSQARIVVIVFRNEWGTTPWTRIEQDAIRDRAYDAGYDFCLLIPLDEPPSKPDWYPKNRIWFGMKRYGIETAAGIIEARVQEAGGMIREETLSDRTERLQKRIQAAEKRRLFLTSEAAVAPAESEAENLLKRFVDRVPIVSNEEIPLKIERERNDVSVSSFGFILQVEWHLAYSNNLSNSGLSVRLIERDRRDRFDRKYNELNLLDFDFDVAESGQYGWRARLGDKKFFSTDDLVDYSLRMIVDKVSEYRLREIARER